MGIGDRAAWRLRSRRPAAVGSRCQPGCANGSDLKLLGGAEIPPRPAAGFRQGPPVPCRGFRRGRSPVQRVTRGAPCPGVCTAPLHLAGATSGAVTVPIARRCPPGHRGLGCASAAGSPVSSGSRHLHIILASWQPRYLCLFNDICTRWVHGSGWAGFPEAELCWGG